MRGAFNLSDLVWGTLNYFKDTLSSNSGDPRRDTAEDFLNAGLRRTFGRDTLKDVNGFTGIILAALDTYQVSEAQKAGLLRDYAQNPSEPSEPLRTAYKVYIPEIEPSPAPQGADDPVLWFYPNIFPNDRLATTQQLGPGDIVKVKYRDTQNLIEPTIVSKEGSVSLAFPSVKTGGLPFKFKATPTIVGGPTGDPGRYSWSNRAKQLTSKHLPSGKTLRNGELESLGLLQTDSETGAQLLPGAMRDFLILNEAFRKKFGKPLQGSGYRSYEGQVRTRMVRVAGDNAGCPGQATGKRAKISGKLGEGAGQWGISNNACKFRGYAATPGRSKHGWGGAVDLSGLSTKEFEWINKFGLPNFNFVFGVSGEKWHINWTGLKDVLDNPPTNGFTRWTEQGVNDEKITLV